MASKKGSPTRRKSIAVTNQNKHVPLPRSKRRPHSIVAGDRLSPLFKARRSLVPRKSILKGSINIPSQDDTQTAQPLASQTDEASSLDLTREIRTENYDNTSRKSLSRRVSFASHAHVRLFAKQNNNTNGTESPQSSPTPASSDSNRDGARPSEPQALSDENAYPGAAAFNRRRSSIRRSVAFSDGGGEESMEMDLDDTAPGPSAFLKASRVTTETPHSDDQDADQSQSFQDDSRNASSIGTNDSTSEPMEFTIPLNQSLRPPGPPDEAWLALRKMTHSGDTPDEPSISSDEGTGNYHEMDLNDAMQRLIRALPVSNDTVERDDSFSSSDNSLDDIGDKTINMSTVYGRPSIGAFDAPMETTSVHGGLVSVPVSEPVAAPAFAPPRAEIQTSGSGSRPSVFQPPSTVFTPAPSRTSVVTSTPKVPSKAFSTPQAASVAFSFTPKPKPSAIPVSKPPAPSSPSKAKHGAINPPSAAKPKFSAAFAPPVARSSPKKRMRNEDSDVESANRDKPSPSKKTALAGRWTPAATTSSSTPDPSQPKPLSPSKKAPFQAPSASRPAAATSSLRRPSDYFARRKSMALSANNAAEVDASENRGTSPKKKAVVGLHRASMGAPLTTTYDWKKDTTVENKGKEREIDGCEREVVRQAIAAPSPTRGSPAPSSSRSNSPAYEKAQVELSQLLANQEEFSLDKDADESMDLDANADSTERWREAVQEQGFAEDEGPPISIEQFFNMTGISFMDEITVPRRSTHPSQLHPRGRRDSGELPDIPLAEYVVAMVQDIPQLDLYTRVSKELQAWMEQIKDVFKQADEEATKVTPELFREYSQASDDARSELLHHLRLIKINNRELAKSEWYDWKTHWVERLHDTAAKGFSELEMDAKAIEEFNTRAQNLLPALNDEYAQVMRELEEEQADVAEIESCDKDYLNELKGSIAEQNVEVEALQAEVAEGKGQLERLQERLEEMELQGREALSAITEAKQLVHLKKNSSTVEVFRLKEELETLENLHMFRVTKVRSDLFEVDFASQFRVSIPCVQYQPVSERVDICRLEGGRTKFKDEYPSLSAFWLHTAKNRIVHGRKLTTTGQIVRRLGDYWSSCTRLRAQLQLLNIKYPLSIEIIQATRDRPSGFRAKAMVLFNTLKAKAFVSFVFDEETFSTWPKSIDSVRCEIEVAYGPLDPDIIFNTVASRMREASAANCHACLLDACIQAMEIFA